MLQHRSIEIDEFKRSLSWTSELRHLAQKLIDKTHTRSCSSACPQFLKRSKTRASKKVLPSLFDASREYEDWIKEHGIWRYRDIKDAPRGKDIKWQTIPRPLIQRSGAKKPRDKEAIREKEAKEASKSTPPATPMLPMDRASQEQTIEAPSFIDPVCGALFNDYSYGQDPMKVFMEWTAVYRQCTDSADTLLQRMIWNNPWLVQPHDSIQPTQLPMCRSMFLGNQYDEYNSLSDRYKTYNMAFNYDTSYDTRRLDYYTPNTHNQVFP